MTDQSTPQGVNLLKELLFDREARRLDDLSRKLEAEAKATLQRDAALDERLDVVFERAGSEERLLHSVAQILDGALREAEIARHDQLSKAIAPLIVRTIKAQLRESQDEMVDALYPITGRLVKSYVQAEINKRMIEINARLGGRRPAELAAKSAATGVSAGDLALAEANKLEVEELFLVRRGSGDLIAHWEKPEPGMVAANDSGSTGNNRDVLLSGYISGIMGLSEEAFGAAPGSFRTLTFANGGRIFVRGSAAHLLAVRCRGSAPAQVEQVIDEVFLDTLERYQKVLASDLARRRNGDAASDQAAQAQTRAEIEAILPAVGNSIEKLTEERRTALAREQAEAYAAYKPSFARVYALAAVVAAPFVAWGLWSAYQSFETMRVEGTANQVLATVEGVQAAPPKIDVGRGGREVTLSGLVASATIKDQLAARLGQELPQSTIRNQLTVLPVGGDVAIAQWQREASARAIARSLARVRERLEPLRAIVAKQEATGAGPLIELRRTLDTALEQAKPETAGSPDEQGRLDALWQTLGRADALLSTAIGGTTAPARSNERPTDARQLAEESALLAERMSAIGFGLPMTARVDSLRPPTARDQLEAIVRSSVVFFGNGTDFRDPDTANGALDQLVRRLKETPEVIVRVVGYTDEKGTQGLNNNLAQMRADRVMTLLTEKGASANRVVAVGRIGVKDVSRVIGVDSANRRVEFEIGYPGEIVGAPQ